MNAHTIGISGEYFVAAELSRRGYIANITLRNAHGVDILVTSYSHPGKSVSVQVKAKEGDSTVWVISDKSESLVSESLFYVFVRRLEINALPLYHVVPSQVVARYCSGRHLAWMSGLKKDGTRRKESSMRKFSDERCEYLNKWELLLQGLS